MWDQETSCCLFTIYEYIDNQSIKVQSISSDWLFSTQIISILFLLISFSKIPYLCLESWKNRDNVEYLNSFVCFKMHIAVHFIENTSYSAQFCQFRELLGIGRNWFVEFRNCVGSDKRNSGNWMEPIPGAELVPQCSTLRNRMTAHFILSYFSDMFPFSYDRSPSFCIF